MQFPRHRLLALLVAQSHGPRRGTTAALKVEPGDIKRCYYVTIRPRCTRTTAGHTNVNLLSSDRPKALISVLPSVFNPHRLSPLLLLKRILVPDTCPSTHGGVMNFAQLWPVQPIYPLYLPSQSRSGQYEM